MVNHPNTCELVRSSELQNTACSNAVIRSLSLLYFAHYVNYAVLRQARVTFEPVVCSQ